ncbi:hypothetical protein O6H91_10G089500 [Diphasiastrum complanatum]|uniref:Uncharacterized protein n=1 Tax=Diphasiastrum complanatum TaxID=34168 RepID=A0ACC2CJG3_DIPCM|nr:hypothetical protein O6H91_Y069100 [Diphasiastrum complanatum]KAJ7542090.1 hypothetical protein O6H91_10G089500 [Diphasiastrum complanatum]
MSAVKRVTRTAALLNAQPIPQQQHSDGAPSRAVISFRAKKLRTVVPHPRKDEQNCAVSKNSSSDTASKDPSLCSSKHEDTSSVTKRRKRVNSSQMQCSSGDGKPVGTEMSCSLLVSSVLSLLDPQLLAAATQHIRMVDERLRGIIDMHEGPKFEKCESAFASLVRSIVSQQLASKAASAIHGRLVTLCGGDTDVTPSTILKLSAAELRVIGISERKANYLHDLASKFTADSLSDSTILVMDDSSLMTSLTAVKGIGVWSVHMFMIFSLHRPDILPVGDLGVRKGFQKLYGLKSLPDAEKMEELSSKWKPYRSLGSWYMWRVLSKTLPFATIDSN